MQFRACRLEWEGSRPNVGYRPPAGYFQLEERAPELM
jgi:hypothetical protein